MSVRNVLLTLAGVAAVALSNGQTLAGDFGIRFSLSSGRDCRVDCGPSRVVYYESVPVYYSDRSVRVHYSDRAPVVVYGDYGPRAVTYGYRVPVRHYRTRTVRHYTTAPRTIHRTVRQVHHRPSYSTRRYYNRSAAPRHYRSDSLRHHRPQRSRRDIGVRVHLRTDRGRRIGASFRHRR